jgi:hypothetical protein
MGDDDKGAELQDGVIRCLPWAAMREMPGVMSPGEKID